jgi:predicted nucleotidyltransferase
MKTEILRMQFGSTLYGTRTPTSDIDIKGVFIPSARDIVLQQAPKVITDNTKLNERAKNTADDVDSEFFSLQQYLKLLMDGQTVCLDMLFAPPSMIESKNYIWDEVYEYRHKFISKQSKAFVGYCRQQANKYGIKGSRVAAVRGVLQALKATGKDEQRLGDVIRDNSYIMNTPIDIASGNNEYVEEIDIRLFNGSVVRHLKVCGRKLPFTIKVKEAVKILQKLFDEYGQRALLAEENAGIDWKAMSHAVRVGREAIDLFETGEIVFPLPYAKHLLEIKTGALPYKEVAEEIESLLELVETAAEKSTLQEIPDYDFAEQLVYDHYRLQVHLNY